EDKIMQLEEQIKTMKSKHMEELSGLQKELSTSQMKMGAQLVELDKLTKEMEKKDSKIQQYFNEIKELQKRLNESMHLNRPLKSSSNADDNVLHVSSSSPLQSKKNNEWDLTAIHQLKLPTEQNKSSDIEGSLNVDAESNVASNGKDTETANQAGTEEDSPLHSAHSSHGSSVFALEHQNILDTSPHRLSQTSQLSQDDYFNAQLDPKANSLCQLHTVYVY
ncbi:hypothetical protein RFI_17852, partial [Reticulomyxa filosa]